MKFCYFLVIAVVATLISSTLGCEDGWKLYGKKCYFFAPSGKKFSFAKSDCTSKDATLAIAKSSGLVNFLKTGIGSNHWIGLTCPSGCGTTLQVATRRGLFKWLDGSSVNKDYWYGASKEPNKGENCGALNPNGKFYGFDCNWSLKYICVKDPPPPEPPTTEQTTTAETTTQTVTTTEASTTTTVVSTTTEASTTQSSTTEATTAATTRTSTTVAPTQSSTTGATTQSSTTMSTTIATATETTTQASTAAMSTSATESSTAGENETTVTTVTTTKTTTTQEITPTEAEMPSMLVIIVGGAVGGAFLLIVIFLLIWLAQSRGKKKPVPEDEPDRRHRKNIPIIGPVIPIDNFEPNPFPVPELINVMRAELDKGKDGFSAYAKFPKKSTAPTSVASNNNKLNRYKDILPYNFNRVELQTQSGGKKMKNAPNDGYINASYVSNDNKVKYIACQGPIPATLAHFWQMIDEADVNVIVMLTPLVESAKRKCECYWPESVGKFEKFGDYNISLENEAMEHGYIKRTLKVTRDAIEDETGDYQVIQDTVRIVTQFYWDEWPDMYVPKDSGPILHMMEQIDQLKTAKQYTGPTLVHCSAGVGRTGTYIAVDFQLQKARRENMLDIHTCVKELREHRMSMIQRQTQWTFIFSTLLEALTIWNSSIKANHLRETVEQRSKRDENGQIMFDQEYEVLEVIAKIISPSEPYNYLHLSSFMQGRDRQVEGTVIKGYTQPEYFYIAPPTKPENKVDLLRLIYDHKVKAVINIVKEEEDVDAMFSGEETFEYFTTSEYNRTNGGTSFLITKTEGESGEEMPETDFTMYTFTKSNHLDILDDKQFVDFYQKTRADFSDENHGAVLVTSTEGYSIAGLFCQATALCDMISVTNEIDVYKTVKKTCAFSLECMPSKAQYLFLYRLAELFVTRGSNRAIARERHTVRIDI